MCASMKPRARFRGASNIRLRNHKSTKSAEYGMIAKTGVHALVFFLFTGANYERSSDEFIMNVNIKPLGGAFCRGRRWVAGSVRWVRSYLFNRHYRLCLGDTYYKLRRMEDDAYMKILIVEDDKTIASGLEYSLQQEQYDTMLCYDIAAAKAVLAGGPEQFALCLFDLSLPDGSGYELCKIVKARGDIPVIFLTAIDDEVNVVMGLDMGADDYITKPFRIRELLSRIKSVLRRYHRQTSLKTVVDIGHIRIQTLEGKVYKRNEEIVLTALEYRLLLIFANHIGQILSRNQLLEQIWDVAGDFVNDNTLTVYIKRLREKLEDDPQQPEIIKTVRGLGYKVGD